MKKIIKILSFTLIIALVTAIVAEYPKISRDDIPSVKEETEEENISYDNFAGGKAILSENFANISAQSGILCTLDGLLIYEKNADTPLKMASITKVMSVVIALENIEDIQKNFVVPKEATGIEGSSVYLKEGEKVTAEMLIYSAMLESANDAVTALAIITAGNTEDFVKLMNEKADFLGMKNTAFKNPHGLSEDGHYTTCRDYAKLMAYALKNDTFKTVIGTKKKIYKSSDGSLTRVLTNHNRLLSTFEGMIGGKTGFTKTSGRTLVTAAQRDGSVLICVTLNAPDDWNDHTVLFNSGFDNVKTVNFKACENKADVKIALGNKESSVISLKEDFSITVAKDSKVEIKFIPCNFKYAPLIKNEVCGKAIIYVDGNVYKELQMVSNETVEKKEVTAKKGIIQKIKSIISKEGK